MTQKKKPVLMAALGLAVAGLGALAILNTQPQPAEAAPTIGQAAPAFSVQDSSGKTRTLDEFKGKYVVLEWLNYGCPFVKKYYNSGAMQKLQADATKDGVVWLSVISSAPGKQGHSTGTEADENSKAHKALPTAVLLDEDGTMGKAYNAKTTPHMFVINPEGNLIYNGAIDDKPTTDLADIPTAHNYVLAALEQARKGEAVTTPTSKPYGCSVKY
jgi:peroxiredoxin